MKDLRDIPIFYFSHSPDLKQVHLTVETTTSMTFEEYKQHLSDFLHDLDVDDNDLFDDNAFSNGMN